MTGNATEPGTGAWKLPGAIYSVLRQNIRIEVTLRSGWIKLAQGLINFPCLAALAYSCVGYTQLIPGICILRLDAQRLPIGMDSVGILFKLIVGIAQVVPAIRIIPLYTQCIPVGVNRVIGDRIL